MDEFNDNGSLDGIDKIAWGIFSKTGNIGHYLFYNNVKQKEQKQKEKDKEKR